MCGAGYVTHHDLRRRSEATYAQRHEAVECLSKDRDALLAFRLPPAEYWKQLRTTNKIESSFATIQHRAVRSMIFKLAEDAIKIGGPRWPQPSCPKSSSAKVS
jgi:transposase-like protein